MVVLYYFVFRTSLGLRLRSVGEHPRAADTVGIDVYKTRYLAVTASGMLAAMGGAYLSIGFVHSFNENMTEGRGFIALAALIFGKWKPFGAFGAACLFGFSTALATAIPSAYVDSTSSDPALGRPLPDPSVHPHARGRRRRDRPVRRAGGRRTPVCQAVGACGSSPSCSERSRSSPCPPRWRLSICGPEPRRPAALVVAVPVAFVCGLIGISAARRARASASTAASTAPASGACASPGSSSGPGSTSRS